MKRKKISYGNDRIDIDSVINDFAQGIKLKISNYKILQIYQRPFSFVYKIRIHFINNSTRTYYLKYYHREAEKNRPDIVERDFNTTLFWHERFKDHKEFNVIKPVYYNKQKFILISEESKGRNLSQFINNYGQFFPSLNIQRKFREMFGLVGKWLRYFQSIPIENQYDELELNYFLDYVEIRLNRLVDNKKLDFDTKLKNQVIIFIKQQWAKIADDDLHYCYTHSDLSLSNILIFKNSITVLDFNEKETGLIYKDLTRLYHQLDLLRNKPTFMRGFIDQLQDAFLKAYGFPSVTGNPLFKIYYLIHMLNHLNKNSRYWEHSFIENLYNHWVVRNSLNKIKKILYEKEL